MSIPKDAGVQAKAAHVIWKTSRADEKTISAAGANIVAAALAEAGLLAEPCPCGGSGLYPNEVPGVGTEWVSCPDCNRAEIEARGFQRGMVAGARQLAEPAVPGACVMETMGSQLAEAEADLHAARAELAEVKAERDHLLRTFFATCPQEGHEHGVWCGSNWAGLKARAEKAEAERDAARKQEASQTRAAVTAWAAAGRLRAELAEAKAEGARQVEEAMWAFARSDLGCALDYCDPDPDSDCAGSRLRAAAREVVKRIEKEAR